MTMKLSDTWTIIEPDPDHYQNKLVDRCAPRWAWDIIDQFIADYGVMDRDTIDRANKAMIDACENPWDE